MPKINEGIDYGGGQKLASKTVTRPTQWNIQMPLDEVVETSVKVAEHVRVQIYSCGIDMTAVNNRRSIFSPTKKREIPMCLSDLTLNALYFASIFF